MATKHRQHTTRRDPGSDLREDVREAIERAWPDGVVEMAFDSDESWFQDVYPKLVSAIQRIKGAQLVREREPEGGPVWLDHSDADEDPRTIGSPRGLTVSSSSARKAKRSIMKPRLKVLRNQTGIGTKTRVSCPWKQLPEVAKPAGRWPYP